MTLFELYERVKKLNTDSVIEESFDDTAKEYADKQREQLTDGFGSDGNRLRKYRSPVYARMKNQMNSKPGFGNPDLRLTGSFHRGITMTANGDAILTGSVDAKTEALEKKYPKALGLAGPYKSDYLEHDLSPMIQRKITEVVGLKFS